MLTPGCCTRGCGCVVESTSMLFGFACEDHCTCTLRLKLFLSLPGPAFLFIYFMHNDHRCSERPGCVLLHTNTRYSHTNVLFKQKFHQVAIFSRSHLCEWLRWGPAWQGEGPDTSAVETSQELPASPLRPRPHPSHPHPPRSIHCNSKLRWGRTPR